MNRRRAGRHEPSARTGPSLRASNAVQDAAGLVERMALGPVVRPDSAHSSEVRHRPASSPRITDSEKRTVAMSGHRRPTGPQVRGVKADESVCTPGSVPARGCPRAGDGHPSRTRVATRLERSTRELGRAALERSLSDLAPGGVYRAAPVTRHAGGLLHHRFTLTAHRGRNPEARRSVFCGTVPRVTPGGRYPPPCPSEPGRSSAPPGQDPAVTRPSDRLVRVVSLPAPPPLP